MKGLIVLLTLCVFASALSRHRISSKPRLDGRIVGGSPISIEQAPIQASYLWYGTHVCGGVIIAVNFVLTAAYCTNGDNPNIVTIRVGSTYYASGGTVVQAQAIYQHPAFSLWTLDFDISLVRLAENLTFGPTISAVPLPTHGQDWAVGTPTRVTGWGTQYEGGSPSLNLQAVEVPIFNKTDCQAAYGSSNEVTPRMLCAGVPQGGLDACQGDSGGPLVILNETSGDVVVLAGLVSWGIGCARPGYPGVYTHVGILRDWIEQTTGF